MSEFKARQATIKALGDHVRDVTNYGYVLLDMAQAMEMLGLDRSAETLRDIALGIRRSAKAAQDAHCQSINAGLAEAEAGVGDILRGLLKNVEGAQ